MVPVTAATLSRNPMHVREDCNQRGHPPSIKVRRRVYPGTLEAIFLVESKQGTSTGIARNRLQRRKKQTRNLQRENSRTSLRRKRIPKFKHRTTSQKRRLKAAHVGRTVRSVITRHQRGYNVRIPSQTYPRFRR
ncbi:hypothetical protein LTR39_004684, partial [Cryomyces antarcticus]